jgi:hypothetical protein
MSDPREQIKSVLQDLINDRQEQAAETIHNYLVAKSQQIAGFAPSTAPESSTETDED